MITPEIRKRLEVMRIKEEAAFADRTKKSSALRDRAEKHMPNGVPMTWMKGLYRTPTIYAVRGEGPRFFDADGNSYLDFNVCDLAMTMGYAPPAIVKAVRRAVEEGAHFLLPTQDAIDVAEELSNRVGLPHWQFTLSASGANAEVLRVARAMTGRKKLVVFQGHYNGHFDEGLVVLADDGNVQSELMGLPPRSSADTIVLPFNDIRALEACLAKRDVALVLLEPAMTNCSLVEPKQGYLQALQTITKKHGSLLCYDEAHTFQFAYGGLVRRWNLESDFVVLGKGLGSGVSFALYGMAEHVARFFIRHSDVDIGPKGIATGGTTYGSNIAAAAAKAALFDVLTPDAFDRIDRLGQRMADGLQRSIDRCGLAWRILRNGPRIGYCMATEAPSTGPEAWASLDVDFIDTRRLYLANRGVWDAVVSAGPQASLAHTEADIDEYVRQATSFLEEMTGKIGS